MVKLIKNRIILIPIVILLVIILLAINPLVFANNSPAPSEDILYITNEFSSNNYREIDVDNKVLQVKVNPTKPNQIAKVENDYGVIIDYNLLNNSQVEKNFNFLYMQSNFDRKIIITGDNINLSKLYDKLNTHIKINKYPQINYTVDYSSNLDMKVIGYCLYKGLDNKPKIVAIRRDMNNPKEDIDLFIYAMKMNFEPSLDSVTYKNSMILSQYHFLDCYKTVNIAYSCLTSKAPNSTNNSPVYELYTPVKIDPSNTLLYGVRDINLSHSSLYNASIYDYMPPKSIGKFKLLSGLSTEPITHNNNNSPIDSNVISGGISSSYIDWLFQSKLIFNSLIFNPVTEYRGSSITLGNQFRLSVPIYSYKGKGFSSQDSLISTIIEFK